AAHTPLARGEPPLTRQAIDACAELLAFLAGQAAKGATEKPDAKLKKTVEHELVARWPKLDHAQQQQVAMLPAYWAAMRIAWSRASESERAAARKQWAESLHQQLAPKMTMAEFMQTANNYRMMSQMLKVSTDMSLYAIGNIGGGQHYEWKWVP